MYRRHVHTNISWNSMQYYISIVCNIWMYWFNVHRTNRTNLRICDNWQGEGGAVYGMEVGWRTNYVKYKNQIQVLFNKCNDPNFKKFKELFQCILHIIIMIWKLGTQAYLMQLSFKWTRSRHGRHLVSRKIPLNIFYSFLCIFSWNE